MSIEIGQQNVCYHRNHQHYTRDTLIVSPNRTSLNSILRIETNETSDADNLRFAPNITIKANLI